jgi:RNA polymerase sigma factor (sigma-70 family)
VRRFARDVVQARNRWYARRGTMPVGTELAHELQIDPDELRQRLQDLDRAALSSLDAPIRDTNDGALAEVGDTVEASDSESPEESALASERRRVLRQAIAALSPRERRLLRLLHVEHLTGAEAGRALGVSESRASQILTSIRTKLRRRIDEYDALGSGPAVA